MPTRLLGVLLLVALLGLAVPVAPVGAVEEGEEPVGPDPHAELPRLEEVVSDSEASRQFVPEPAEEQPFTEALIFPLLAVGVIAVLVIGALYLKWQPHFGREDSRR